MDTSLMFERLEEVKHLMPHQAQNIEYAKKLLMGGDVVRANRFFCEKTLTPELKRLKEYSSAGNTVVLSQALRDIRKGVRKDTWRAAFGSFKEKLVAAGKYTVVQVVKKVSVIVRPFLWVITGDTFGKRAAKAVGYTAGLIAQGAAFAVDVVRNRDGSRKAVKDFAVATFERAKDLAHDVVIRARTLAAKGVETGRTLMASAIRGATVVVNKVKNAFSRMFSFVGG